MPPSAIPICQVPKQPHIKNEIGRKLFGAYYQPQCYPNYFKYLAQETLDLKWPEKLPKQQQVAELAVKTHEELLEVVGLLRKSKSLKRETIRAILDQKFRDNHTLNANRDVSLNRTMDIAIRRWLMINTREEKFKGLGSGGSCVTWNDGLTLEECIESLFPVATWTPTPREGRLSPYFTAANMVNICGLEIKWTTYLENHLYLNRKDKILWVFPFKCCLQAFISDKGSQEPADGYVHSRIVVSVTNLARALLSQSLLTETIKTLDLLFPAWDVETRKLLGAASQDFHTIEPVAESRQLNLIEYDHWRTRLLDVYDEIYLSPPVSWRQLWRDRRNPQQFWTFWIALVILMLTLVSTAAGIAQTYASFQSLKCLS
jgi:hypothetical protein